MKAPSPERADRVYTVFWALCFAGYFFHGFIDRSEIGSFRCYSLANQSLQIFSKPYMAVLGVLIFSAIWYLPYFYGKQENHMVAGVMNRFLSFLVLPLAFVINLIGMVKDWSFPHLFWAVAYAGLLIFLRKERNPEKDREWEDHIWCNNIVILIIFCLQIPWPWQPVA
jgi:hypothetical protein